jgi:cell division protein FtsW
MADQPIVPTFVDVDLPNATADGDVIGKKRVLRPTAAAPARGGQNEAARANEKKRSFIATLDTPIVVVLGILLAIGLMMVYSTTFDWSYQTYGSESTIFMQHAKNMGIGLVVTIALVLVDYRLWRRFAVVLLLITYALLIGVLLFGDNTFGARRAFFNGSYQPGELAELIIIVYMAAWLGSKSTRIRSITHGLLPFAFLVGSMSYLVMLQPDLSTVAMIVVVAGIMFFLAGADLMQLLAGGAVMGIIAVAVLSSQRLNYAQDRVSSYLSGASDLTQANYHVQQAVIAFINGGWTGVGLGEGRQKFGFLPAPHTDSIFAVIGEELGVLGAALVVALYVILVIRGLQIARRAPDTFGALLASGVTIWIAAKALLNIAVMTAVLPATGAPLPFISFGGSSLLVMMSGAGLLLSVARVSARLGVPEWRNSSANLDRGGGNRGARLPRAGRSRGDKQPAPRR